MCKVKFVRGTAIMSTNVPAVMPVKPTTCIRMLPNRGTAQIPRRKHRNRNRSIAALLLPFDPVDKRTEATIKGVEQQKGGNDAKVTPVSYINAMRAAASIIHGMGPQK
jgi:hypothetical protein